MSLAIVGNRGVDLAAARPILAELLRKYAEGMRSTGVSHRILVRCPRSGQMAPFEALVAELAAAEGLDIVPCYPDRQPGRAGTYVRDAHMVQTAEAVIAFFPAGKLMEGGTGHVVEKAIEKEKPVHAYELDGTGLRWVGSME